MEESTRIAAARERVEQQIALGIHVVAFVAVNVMLFSLAGRVDITAGHFWGWGIGLAVHAVHVVTRAGGGVVDRLVGRQLERQHPAGGSR